MKKKYKFFIFIIIALFIVAFGFYSFLFFINEESNKDYNLDEDIFLFYSRNRVETNERVFYGYEEAPITFVFFTDVFINNERALNILNQVKAEHIDNNEKVKIMHKFYINEEDIQSKSDRYLINCLLYNQYLKSENVFEKMQSVLKEPINLENYLTKNNISQEDLNNINCNEMLIYEDYTDLRRFGLVGLNPIFIIGIAGRDNQVISGIPTYNRVNRTINEFYTRIGHAH